MNNHTGPLTVVRHGWERCSLYARKGASVATLSIREEEGEEDVDERAMFDARLLCAAYNSYDRHAVDPVAAAEGDLLGEALSLLGRYVHHDEVGDDAPHLTRSDLYRSAVAVLAKVKPHGT